MSMVLTEHTVPPYSGDISFLARSISWTMEKVEFSIQNDFYPAGFSIEDKSVDSREETSDNYFFHLRNLSVNVTLKNSTW